jgi:hypothetical protein
LKIVPKLIGALRQFDGVWICIPDYVAENIGKRVQDDIAAKHVPTQLLKNDNADPASGVIIEIGGVVGGHRVSKFLRRGGRLKNKAVNG